MNDILQTVLGLPPLLIYLVVGAGAAIENIFPPVPADTFVLAGAFIAATGRVDPLLVFLSTWVANVGSAMAVYAVARKHGNAFFATTIGGKMLNQKQLDRIGYFYGRWGTSAIFFSRFLPAFRSLVPVFAGVSQLGAWRTGIPVAVASGLWYGILVLVGAFAGRNFNTIMSWMSSASAILLVVAGILIAAFGLWWWRTRHHET